MSNFWANKVAPQPAPAPVAPAPQSGPWWQRSQAVPVAPVVAQAPQPVAYGSGTPQTEQGLSEALVQTNYQTTKARSSLDMDKGLCPGCGGPNYVNSASSVNSMPHCFDCGYNPRFEQTMSGVSAGGQNIPVQSARQQHGNTQAGDYMKIIAHV